MIFSGDVLWEQHAEESIHPSQTKAGFPTATSPRASTSGLKAGCPVSATSIPGPSFREVKEKLGVSGKKILICKIEVKKVQESLLCSLLAEHQDLLSVQLVSKTDAGD